MDINASHLLIVCLGIVIGMIVWSLYQRRGQITAQTLMEGIAAVPGQTKQMYDDAVIFVQWLEQVGKPDKDGQGGLTGDEKKQRALAVMKRRWANADIETIDRVIEAAVFGVKALGLKVPQVRITGEAELVDKWLKQQPGSEPF